MDNLRRELQRENRPVPSWFNPDRIEKLSIKLQEPETLPSYVVDFGKLDAKQQEIAECAFDTFGCYMEASLRVISLVMGGEAKARKAAEKSQDVAFDAFVVSGAVLVGTVIEDMAADREGFWPWFGRFYDGLDTQSKLTWADFGNLLLEESLPLYFAQQVADSPQQTARLRGLFSAENWH
jgi:hypothetical protein